MGPLSEMLNEALLLVMEHFYIVVLLLLLSKGPCVVLFYGSIVFSTMREHKYCLKS